ncbi:hypothetical protein TI04_05950 [Achromatium sp. WMS2]|nr:hypothetical protein TI04_05950 [Achromatium sp. WMS2]
MCTTNLSAEEAPAPNANPNSAYFSPAVRASLKTVTFQAAANLSDTLIFGMLTGADTHTSLAFLFANTASAMAVYFPYELAWNTFGPDPEDTNADTLMLKTGAYQAITGVRNLALSYAFSGEVLSSAAFVVGVVLVDSVIYAANEVAWDIISPRASTPQPK